MEKKIVKAIFIIPFCDKDILQLPDTIASIKYYIKEPYAIICVNDCKNKDHLQLLQKTFYSENVINFVPKYESDQTPNAYGSLCCNLFQAIEYALENMHFDYLIKIDTDALVTGDEFLESVDTYFEQNHPNIGLLGSYKIRADGRRRTRWQWASYLLYLVYFKRQLLRKSTIWNVCLPRARKNGYRLGESVLGGAYIFSYKCISRIIDLYPYQLIKNDKIYLTQIGEDVIFSLLTFASDFMIGDFGRPEDPLAVAQRYLPIAKEEVLDLKKQLVHSINKGKNGENEDELRSYFRSARN